MFKLIDILGKTKQVEVYESYMVRWKGINDIIYGSIYSRAETEVFTTEESAKEFARSLKAAFKLVKCDVLISHIKVTKN